MPTLTSLALETLLQPKKPELGYEPRPKSNPRHVYIRPNLYSTPEQTPIPDFSPPEPVSPSPYVANHKRRRGHGAAKDDKEERGQFPEMALGNHVIEDLGSEEVGDGFGNNDVGSEIECRSFVSATGEFFDANDDFSSDGSMSGKPSSHIRKAESELHSLRVTLLEEIGKRKAAEETLALLRNQWERLSDLVVSESGISFPSPPITSDGMNLLDENSVQQFCQEIVVTRFVSEAIGRALARIETEESAAVALELKDQEISRLRDKLQYYETVNHEMSQRKLVEVARRQQQRKRSKQMWVWSLMGISLAMGASFLVYSYVPQHSNETLSSLQSGDSNDVISSAENL